MIPDICYLKCFKKVWTLFSEFVTDIGSIYFLNDDSNYSIKPGLQIRCLFLFRMPISSPNPMFHQLLESSKIGLVKKMTFIKIKVKIGNLSETLWRPTKSEFFYQSDYIFAKFCTQMWRPLQTPVLPYGGTNSVILHQIFSHLCDSNK